MEKNLAYYRAIQNSIGCQSKADWIRNNTIRSLENSFENPVDVEDFTFWTFNKESDKIRLEVVDEDYSAANGNMVEVTSLISFPVVIGDVLHRIDTDTYYICTESYKKSRMFYKCVLTRCNYWMRWQDDKKNIFEYPVFEINSTQYNSGESGDKTLTLGSSQHLVTITADENTIPLDHGKRFFWDRDTVNPTVFKITQNDTTAMNYDKGLLKITVMEDQYDSDKDSIENWLCDYFKVSEVTILYSGSPTIRVGGTKTLTVDSTDTVEWNIISDIGATIAPNGNTAKVKCPYGTDFVGKEITVTATVNGNSGQCVLTVTGGV